MYPKILTCLLRKEGLEKLPLKDILKSSKADDNGH